MVGLQKTFNLIIIFIALTFQNGKIEHFLNGKILNFLTAIGWDEIEVTFEFRKCILYMI